MTINLILHPCLDQIDGIDGCSASSTSDGTQQETVGGFQDLNHDTTIFRALQRDSKNFSLNLVQK